MTPVPFVVRRSQAPAPAAPSDAPVRDCGAPVAALSPPWTVAESEGAAEPDAEAAAWIAAEALLHVWLRLRARGGITAS